MTGRASWCSLNTGRAGGVRRDIPTRIRRQARGGTARERQDDTMQILLGGLRALMILAWVLSALGDLRLAGGDGQC